MTVITSAELKPNFLDQVLGTDKVWTGKAIHVESGKEATAYGNSREAAIYNASEKLSQKLRK